MSDSQSLYHLELSDKFKPTLDQVNRFITDKILPVVEEYYDTPNTENRWSLSDRQ